MISFSVFDGVEVLSKTDYAIIGKITDAILYENCKKIAYFVTDGNNPFLIPLPAVKSVEDVAVVEDEIGLIGKADIDPTAFSTVLGKTVYTPFGLSKGKITDFSFDEKGRIAIFKTTIAEISPTEIKGVGDVVILKENRKPKKRKADFSSLAVEDAPVFTLSQTEISPTEESDGAIIPPATIKVELENTFVPPRIISDYNFLLGRILTADLVSYSGELLAPANTYVTVDLVEKARAHGKLLDLTLNSK